MLGAFHFHSVSAILRVSSLFFLAPVALPNLSQEWLEELGFCSMVEENEISQEGMVPNDYHTTVANNGITCRIKKLEIPSGVILLDDASITQ